MKKIATIFILTLIVLCFTGCGNSQKLRRYQERINKLEEEKEDLLQTISELDSEKIDLLSENDSLRIELSNSEEANNYLLSKDNSDSLSALRAENEKLKAQLSQEKSSHQNAQNTQSVVQVYPVNINHAQLLYSLMFSPDSDGKKYEDKNPTWYSNPYCIEQTKINQKMILISDVVIKWKLPNGTTVYTCRTVDNDFVYSMEKPSLSVIN